MGKETFRHAVEWLKHLKIYFVTLAKWLVVSVFVGVLCGLIGTAFHYGVSAVTAFRGANPWMLYLLPVAGLVITAIYQLTRQEGVGTDAVLSEVQTGTGLHILLLPAIFLSTILTHACGGSAGREGAALQMGGTIGYQAGRLFRLDERDMRTVTMVGMAAFFTALFGTPLAASIFSIVVISIGALYHAAFIPCFTASLTAYGVSLFLGVEPEHFSVAVPAVSAPMFVKVAALAALCALVSVLFVSVIHFAEHNVKRLIPNKWLRAVIGGCAIIALTLLVGSTDYNGAGMNIIEAAIEEGRARPEAFLMKLLFTAVTLSTGFKGGEVVPSFFVGATFGCVVGPLLGIPAGFAAAVGLVAVFCGAVNCPIASTFLAIELFGADGLLFYALACGMSFMLSGYSSLYSSQKILYSKLKAQYINVHANAYHAGQPTEASEKYSVIK